VVYRYEVHNFILVGLFTCDYTGTSISVLVMIVLPLFSLFLKQQMTFLSS